jgi:protein-S-isoprenylcysteine O-methyltransferase Ste14
MIRSEPTSPIHRLRRFKPPRITLLIVTAATLVHLSMSPWSLPAFRIAGGCVFIAGLALMLRAWWLFRGAATPICPTDHATTLLTNDVYTFTRNPMYLGIVAMLAGMALFSGWPAYYVAAILNFLILDTVFCPFEEGRLRAAFGDYETYSARVRRWI